MSLKTLFFFLQSAGDSWVGSLCNDTSGLEFYSFGFAYVIFPLWFSVCRCAFFLLLLTGEHAFIQ